MNDRQSILQSIIEGALRAAADPAVTAVLRTWDYYDTGTSAQPLMPFLVVGVTDDAPLGIGFGLYRASVSVTLVVHWAESARDQFDRIRGSVRAVIESLRGLESGGVHISGVREVSCTEPEIISPQGDVVLTQVLIFSAWFEAPVPGPAVLDPTPFMVDRRADGTTYITCSAVDPRRITRITQSGSVSLVAHGFGAWDSRESLVYSASVPPLSTQIPPTVTG